MDGKQTYGCLEQRVKFERRKWRAQSEKARTGVEYVFSRKEWVSLGSWGATSC